MLPKSLRLPSNMFLEVKKKGTLFHSRNLSVLVLKSDNKASSRFGIVVSTKVSKLAVDRNRIKRIIKLFIVDNQNKLKNGSDVAILTKTSILKSTQSDIFEDMSQALTKAGLI